MRKNKLKILHIITQSLWGGAQRVCYNLVKNLNKEKIQVEVACGPGGILFKKLKENNILVHPIKSFRRDISFLNDLKTFFSLYGLIKKQKYDIVHCHSTKAGFLGRIAAKLAGIKKIYFTVHGWGFYNKEEYDWAEKLLVFLEKIAAKCSTKIICVSERVKEDGIQKKITKEDKFLVIKNGIDWKTKKDRERVRKKIKIRNDEIVFGMIGRLAYPKNPLMFLKAGKKITGEHPEVKLILIGNGPLMENCKNFVRENRLENSILLLGEKPPEETRKLLLGFDVFILTSRFEGLPLTVIEAMFAGLPIIATNVGGVGELVIDGENGFLVNPDSLEELVQKMIYLMKNPEKRKEMGKNGKKIAKEHFTLDKMIKNYERLYLEC